MNYKENLKIIVEAIEQLDKLRDYFEDNDYKSVWTGPWPNWKDRTSKDGYVVLRTYGYAITGEMKPIFESVNLGSEVESFEEGFDDALNIDADAVGADTLDDLTLGDLEHTLDWVDEVIIFLEKTEKLLEEKIWLEDNFEEIIQRSLEKLYLTYSEGEKAKGDLDREARSLMQKRVSKSIGDDDGRSYDSYTYVGSFYKSLYYLRRNSKNELKRVIDSDVWDDLNDVVDQIIDNGDLIFDRERVALKWLESWYDNGMEVIEEIIEQLETQL